VVIGFFFFVAAFSSSESLDEESALANFSFASLNSPPFKNELFN